MEKLERTKKNFEEGIKFFQKKDFKQAQIYFEKTLEDAPNSPPTLENLSKSYLATKDYDKAEKILKYFISLKKEDDQIAYKLLYEIYSTLNKYDELKNLTKAAMEKKKFDKEFHLKSLLFYPSFFNSKKKRENTRADFEKRIDKMLLDLNLPKLDISNVLLKPPIHDLWGDGRNNLEINKKIVTLFKKIYPKLDKYSNLIKDKNYKKEDKIKIGFISQFFSDHSIMKLYEGLIYNLDKKIFDVYVFHSDKTLQGKRFERMWSSCILYNFENIILPKEFDEKVKLISEKKLDILFYPDIHLSTNLYFLTFIKLAKVQITSFGHGDTTGNEKIDYFLTSELMEVKGYESRYSENILLSKFLPMFYYKPIINENLDKNQLSKKNIYSCLQSLFKIDSEFDFVIKKILQKDKLATINFIKDRKEILSKNLFNRLKKIVPEHIERVNFLERLNPQDYINNCGLASVLLNPLSYPAGNTFLDSMYYGTPFLSISSTIERFSIVQGGYNQMRIENPPISDNLDDYIERAVEIANSDNYDLKMYCKEQANKHLYENFYAVRDLEKIFKSLII